MPTARYFIVHDQVQDEWMIKYGDDEFGPYKTQDEAMLFAIDAAQKLGSLWRKRRGVPDGRKRPLPRGMGRRARQWAQCARA